MTALHKGSGAETDARIGKVLSATLQSVVARQMTGSGAAAATAFLVEFDDELARAMAQGPEEVLGFYGDLVAATATALYSVVTYVADQAGQDPIHLLRALVRNYRKAGRS